MDIVLKECEHFYVPLNYWIIIYIEQDFIIIEFMGRKLTFPGFKISPDKCLSILHFSYNNEN